MTAIAETVIGNIGRKTLGFVQEMGRFGKLMSRVVAELGGLFTERQLFFQQAINLGIGSLPLVLIVGFFTGAVSGWQGAYQLQGLMPMDLIGPGTFKGVMIELGPVLTGLVIAGRVAASIAAEIGTMKVTEQIDALEAMAISSVRYLAVPRIAAMTMMMPILVIQAVFIAMMGAYIVLVLFLSLTPNQFWGSDSQLLRYLRCLCRTVEIAVLRHVVEHDRLLYRFPHRRRRRGRGAGDNYRFRVELPDDSRARFPAGNDPLLTRLPSEIRNDRS